MAEENEKLIVLDTKSIFQSSIDELQSEIKVDRKKALQNIKEQLFETEVNLESDLVTAYPILHTYILRCFSDNAEICRDLSIDIISRFVDKLPPNDYYLTYIVPVIVKRIGQVELVEDSEEIRLSLVILAQNIIKKYYETSYLVPFFNDFTNILVKTSSDPYPKVKKEACETIILLSNAIARDFHMQAESFIKPVLSNFSHQHFRVRVTAIQCIGAIVMNGNAKCFELTITPMAEKLFDECSPVRLQVTKEVGNWMLNYRDRYSFWYRMIPLLLTSLSDVMEDIRREAETLWDAVGKQYILENEEDLKPLMDFCKESPAHYPKVSRPNLGCRTLVERNIGKIIPAINKELEGWQADTRLRSAQLLCWLVLGAEFGILQHAAVTTRCLIRGARDEDSRITAEIYRASELFGYFVQPDVWWKLLNSELDTWGCLAVIANIIKGSHPDGFQDIYLKKIVKKLAKPEYCRIRKYEYQINLLRICEALMIICTKDCQKVSQELFNIMFTVYSMSAEDETVEFHALCLLDKLRCTIKCGSHINELYCQYITSLLGNITSDAYTWTLLTPDRCILDTILIHTGSALGVHLHLLSPLLIEALSSPDIDPEVKLKLFTSLSSVLLSRDEKFRLAKPGNLQAFLNVILEGAIIPNMLWMAGRTAESIRTAAVCCLCAILQDNETFSEPVGDVDFANCTKSIELFPTKDSLEPHVNGLIPLLIGLIEDNSKTTRQYALRALCCITKLAKRKDCFTSENLHKIYPVVLKRLDDNIDKVRLASVQTLCILFQSRPEDYDLTTYNAHIDALYSAMLIHLDDPEESYQKEILEALKVVSDVHPKLMKKKVSSNMKLFRNKSALENLDRHLEALSI